MVGGYDDSPFRAPFKNNANKDDSHALNTRYSVKCLTFHLGAGEFVRFLSGLPVML